MIKSIYKEADLILNGRIADGEVKSFKITGTTYCKITNALKQAQKQEKLLELYKRLIKVQTLLSRYKIHTINRDKIEKYEREVFDITKQIKELEK